MFISLCYNFYNIKGNLIIVQFFRKIKQYIYKHIKTYVNFLPFMCKTIIITKCKYIPIIIQETMYTIILVMSFYV